MSLFIIIICNAKTFAQDIDNYITKNKKEYKTNDTAAILKVFSKEVLDSTRLFIVGENHDVYYNDSIKFNLFKNLYYHANVRIIFEEQPLSFIYFVQNYIETGNDSVIKEIGKRYQNEHIVDGYIPYRNFYSSIPATAKFKLTGINFDPCTWFTIYFFYDIFKNKAIPVEISDVVNCVNNFYDSDLLPSKKRLIKFIAIAEESMKKNDSIYKQILKEKYILFVDVVHGLDIYIKFPDNDYTKKPNPERELFMFENIDTVIKQNPNQNYFSQLGYIHIPKKKGDWIYLKNWESLINILNTRNTIVSNKITVMKLYYVVPMVDYKIYNNCFLTKTQRIALNKQYDRVYMLKTGAPESPFKEYSDYIDYLIIDNVSKYHYYNLK